MNSKANPERESDSCAVYKITSKPCANFVGIEFLRLQSQKLDTLSGLMLGMCGEAVMENGFPERAIQNPKP